MLRWSHHVDIFGTLHFIVRCLADRSEGPLPPCSCRRHRCSCTPPASASSPTPAMDIESRPNHVDSWSPAREELMGKHTYIHTYIPIRCKSTEVNIPSSCASALARRQVLNYMSSSHTAPTVKNRLCIYFPHICCYKPPISQYNR